MSGLTIASARPNCWKTWRRDFHYFAVRRRPQKVSIEATLGRPPWERIPVQFASPNHAECVIYDSGNVRFNDYQHEALAIYDFSKEEARFGPRITDLLYEITYLLCLSRIGEIPRSA